MTFEISFSLSHSLCAELHIVFGFFFLVFAIYFKLSFFILVLFFVLFLSLAFIECCVLYLSFIRSTKIAYMKRRIVLGHILNIIFLILLFLTLFFFFWWCLVELSNHIFVNAIFKCIYFMYFFFACTSLLHKNMYKW